MCQIPKYVPLSLAVVYQLDLSGIRPEIVPPPPPSCFALSKSLNTHKRLKITSSDHSNINYTFKIEVYILEAGKDGNIRQVQRQVTRYALDLAG